MSRKTFILIGLFWLALIGGLVGFKEFTLRTGEEILLRTVPVDPRDLFRGDYVVLSYEISSFNTAEIDTDLEMPLLWVGHNVYTALEIRDGYGTAIGIYSKKPEWPFIKGHISSLSSAGEMRLSYGIESYFVPEGKGELIEERRDEGIDVRVSVDAFGNAVIQSLVIGGKDFSF
jgi:uncharacterized membrane-anchored protein